LQLVRVQLQLASQVAIGAVMQLQLGWVRLQLVRNQLQLVRRVAIGAVAQLQLRGTVHLLYRMHLVAF